MTWVAVHDFGGFGTACWVADVGPFIGEGLGFIGDTLAPPPDLPAGYDEIDYMMGDPTGGSLDGYVPPNLYDLYRRANGSTFGDGYTGDRTGQEIWVVLYPTGFPAFGSLGSAPTMDPLSLVYEHYASAGTFPGPTIAAPSGRFSIDNTGTIIDSGLYHETEPFPFGTPGAAHLTDGSWVVAIPRFADGTDNNITVRVWHLDADLSVLGTLDVTAADTWGAFAGTRVVSTGTSALVFASNRKLSPDTIGYTWIVDCSAHTPSQTASSSFASDMQANPRRFQVAPSGAYDSGSNTVLVVGENRNVVGYTVAAFDGSSGALLGQINTTPTDTVPMSAYFNPADPTECTVFDDEGNLTTFTGLPTSPAAGTTVANPHAYEPLASADPYVADAINIDMNDDDSEDNVYFTRYKDADPGSAVDFAHQTDLGIGLGGGNAGASDVLGLFMYSLRDGFNTSEVKALCSVGSATLDVLTLDFPSPIDPTAVDSLAAGSFAAAINPTSHAMLVVGCVLNFNTPTSSDTTMRFVGWTVDRAALSIGAWGIPA